MCARRANWWRRRETPGRSSTRHVAQIEETEQCGWSQTDVLYRDPAGLMRSGAAPTYPWSAKGNDEQLPAPRLSGGFGFRKATVVGARGNEEEAPRTAIYCYGCPFFRCATPIPTPIARPSRSQT